MLRIRLLGEQTIVDDASGVVPTRSSRAVALVGFLALHADSAQTRQRIAGLFWPDSGDAQALTNLRRELHHLRQALGDGSPLVVTATDLRWCDGGSARVDVHTFAVERTAALEAAAQDDVDGLLAHGGAALGEYRGEFLPGAYDDWVLAARSELEEQCAALCDLVCSARTRRGDLAGAVDVARRRIVLRPLEESGYRALMQLQAELGDAAAAVSTYHRCASVLEAELGVVPGPATREVLQQVMSHLGPVETRRPGTVAAGRSGRGAAHLVGRIRDLDALHEMWRSAVRGRAGLALVTGGAGVGKTRLVSEIADTARQQGAVVLMSRCFAASPQLTLAPVADWLREPAVRSVTSNLEAPWRDEVDRLMPSSGAATVRPAGAGTMLGAWQRHRFFEGLARALLALGRPTLLILDNIHWCDQETLAFVTFLLALAPEAPLLVAGTLRNDEPDEDRSLTEWVTRMRASGVLSEHALSPLSRTGTAELAQAVAGQPMSPDEIDLLHDTTGGFPLFVIEAVRAMTELGESSLPGGNLTDVLRDRLDRASEVAQEVAGLAAAVGTNFTLDLLAEASDLRPEAVVSAVDELWRRRLLRELQDGYDFSHDLIRDVAYAQVSPAKRWLLHRRIAQGLELLHPEDSEPLSALLAHQYERGGRPERAVRYYRQAAELASAVFAHREAIRMLESALAIISAAPESGARDRQELAVREALAAPLNAREGYSSTRLQANLERSIALAEQIGNRDSVLNALAGLWSSRFVQGRTADGYEVALRILDLAGADSERSGPAHFALGGSAISLGRPEEGVRHLELAARLSTDSPMLSVGTRPGVHSTAWAAHGYWLLGDDQRAQWCSREAIARARAIEHPYSIAVALAYGAITDQMREDLDELRRKVAELSERCERYGFAYYREWALVLGGWASPDGSGLETARLGIDRLKAAGSFARMPYWLSLVADLLSRDGSQAAARATLDGALAAARAHDDLWWIPEVMRMRAAHDEPPAAVERLREAAATARAHGSRVLLQRCERDLAALGGEGEAAVRSAVATAAGARTLRERGPA